MKIRSVRLAELDASQRRQILHRSSVPDPGVRAAAASIVESVRAGGDTALADAAASYGGGAYRIPMDQVEGAWTATAPDLQEALRAAGDAIRTVHEPQRPDDHLVESNPGVVVRRRWSALRRVGAYVPGGLAAYPSSLLMVTIPAHVAGVSELVVATPAAEDGTVSQALLAAAHVVGVTELYAMGGAQAIGAMAYGTETIPRVDKIVGPGNAWVTAAKLAVFGDCDIDLPAGPSESLVLVDGAADPMIAAADIACQAEHGPDSPVVVVTDTAETVEAIQGALDDVLHRLGRREILEQSLGNHGLFVLVDSWTDAIEFTNEYAPEHLSILTENPQAIADQITGAGSVFVGHWAPESAGDYATGANHVLPTGGLARSSGPLATEDFGTWRQEQSISRQGLAAILPTIAALATAEGLDAHRLAAEIRFEKTSEGGAI